MKKSIKLVIFSLGVFAINYNASAQVKARKIGDNPTILNGAAVLEIESQNKGVLIPRLALTGITDATTITGGNVNSLLVYNTAAINSLTPGYYYWKDTAWVRLVDGVDVAALVHANTTNTLAGGSNKLTSTVNGIAADLIPASGAIESEKVLGFDATGNLVVGSDSQDWNLDGNAATDASTNFIGTRDGVDFVTRTNNSERVRVTKDGHVGIGVAAPTSIVAINGAIALPVLSTDQSVTLDETNSVVRIKDATGNVVIALPDANTAAGRIYTILKADHNLYKISFNKVLKGNGFEIDTATGINVPGEYRIQSDGNDWILLK